MGVTIYRFKWVNYTKSCKVCGIPLKQPMWCVSKGGGALNLKVYCIQCALNKKIIDVKMLEEKGFDEWSNIVIPPEEPEEELVE